jgi:hypothetical protein
LNFLVSFVLFLFAACASTTCAQTIGSSTQGQVGMPIEGQLENPGQPNSTTASQNDKQREQEVVPEFQQQPQRILGILPNFRAVSAGFTPPPPTPKQAFIIATKNSFDYSSFVFVGMTSALAEWTNTHPRLGQGMEGYGNYYWRGFVDKTTGNYFVIFAYPTIFHHDERYYAMGKGPIWKRATYAATRIFVARDYYGNNVPNVSEVLGRATSQSISLSYYPSQDQTAGKLAVKFGYALGRDALTNVFREFWPDIATHVLHRHP